MASLQTTAAILSSSSSNCYSVSRAVNASIHVPKLPRVAFSVPKAPTRKLQIIHEDLHGSIEKTTTTTPLLEKKKKNGMTTQIYDGVYTTTTINKSKVNLQQLYAILEAVSDRVEMHNNVAQQRNNWNTLLLNSINMITLTATTMAGLAAATSAEVAPLKQSSTLLFSAATGMLLIMNKIQPSQLVEEQRNATRLFKNLQGQIETIIALGNPTDEDVKSSMEKVLALDKAYPLPLLGAMLEKFPKKFEPAVWWPNTQLQRKSSERNNKNKKITTMEKRSSSNINGWSEELEVELREVIEVVKRKDAEDYERLGNIALKVNKSLAIAGPLLTGIAAVGSCFAGSSSWAGIVPVMAGSLGAAINALEHGGQVGMVFEMYRNCGGFFKLLEESIEGTLKESDLEKRENGEVFEMKVAMKLGRSVSQLRELASKSASYCMEGVAIDEFASKLF